MSQHYTYSTTIVVTLYSTHFFSFTSTNLSAYIPANPKSINAAIKQALCHSFYATIVKSIAAAKFPAYIAAICSTNITAN